VSVRGREPGHAGQAGGAAGRRIFPALPERGDGARTLLVLTIDTEEEGRWQGTYPREGNRTTNIAWLKRLDPMLAEFGVKPTFLVDYPVVQDPAAREILAEMTAARKGEVGAHLHPWCNPPYDGEGESGAAGASASTYAGRLPAPVLRAKLGALADAIERGFGAAPRSYRAGRWGFSGRSLEVLEELGFLVDTTVIPLRWERGKDAPSFLSAPMVPYFPDRADPFKPGASSVLEVPVPSIVTGRMGPAVEAAARWLRPFPGMGTIMEGLGRAWLRPSTGDPDGLRRVAQAFLDRRLPVLQVMFHSSELMPGASPYVRDAAGLEAFLARLRAVLEIVCAGRGVVPATLLEVRERLTAAPVRVAV